MGNARRPVSVRCPTSDRDEGRSSVVFLAGLVLVVATKVADAVTTVVGLSVSSRLVEANVVAQKAIALVGMVEGLLVLGGASVVATVLVVEWAASVVAEKRVPWLGPGILQGVSYGSLSAVYVAATLRNVELIVSTTSVDVIGSVAV